MPRVRGHHQGQLGVLANRCPSRYVTSRALARSGPVWGPDQGPQGLSKGESQAQVFWESWHSAEGVLNSPKAQFSNHCPPRPNPQRQPI
eukprot:9147640-Pyramimonas_sp.AAC.1